MKTILRFLAVGLATVGGLTATANAGHWRVGVVVNTSVSSYLRCGCPVYTERYVRCIDPCGYPVYGYRVLAVNHVCRAISPPCPPPVYFPQTRMAHRPPPDCWRHDGSGRPPGPPPHAWHGGRPW